ncbi:unnamed protein product [Ixodes hexagonus]
MCPFRAIVTERGTWQRQMATFLQKQLAPLDVGDPFRVANSEVVCDFLKDNEARRWSAFSVDVEDLFYSLPHDQLLASVRYCIETNGELGFRNSSGVALEDFLEMLQFYLNSMVVGWNNSLFLQKQGVCIGSCVAPILSDIYLSGVDRAVESALGASAVKRAFRYVDDFLVLYEGAEEDDTRSFVLASFEKCGGGLRFTCEEPNEGALQFLDLTMYLGDKTICWTFSPRSRKAILDFRSSHSKVVKRAIAMSCLGSALKKSCAHKMSEGFGRQIGRLKESGFPLALLAEVASTLLKKAKGVERAKAQKERKRMVVVPYLHRVSHNLKQVGGRYGIPVVFSAPQKIGQICYRVGAGADGRSKAKCSKAHRKPFVTCVSGVVYRIPLSCDRCYVGQTGRCLNDRLREHSYSLSATVGGLLPIHCRDCKCRPDFGRVTILGKQKDRVTREIIEAFHIACHGGSCVSEPSLTLSGEEMSFLRENMSHVVNG